MLTFKKNLISISAFLFLLPFSFALPHVTPTVPDFSGQYVYYKDSSFARESYIGILYYDENTYALRYYAPQIGKGKDFKPEKSVHILFTVNPEKTNLELTGERIISTIQPDDTDLINFIHEFFYEMTARRQNAGIITENKSLYQEYEQYGGDVTVYYNPLIPIFNMEKIDSVDKKTILQVASVGQLVSAEDQSFAKFSGINEKISDKNHKFKKNKKAKPLPISYKAREESQPLTAEIDTSWKAVAENFYLLGEVASFTVNEVTAGDKASDSSVNQIDILKRRLLMGSDMTFSDWSKLKIEEDKNSLLFRQVFYNLESDSYTYDFKFLKKIDEKTFGLYTLTVFAGAYEPNRKYFENIVKSFK